MQLPQRSVQPLWLLALWLVINLLQAAFSPLDADETYYWMYASQLDWGYFDHPPAVAVLISLGRDWLPGAFGLRLGHVLASTVTIAGLWYLLEKPRGPLLWLAAGLIFAQPMLHVYGFIATPDGPLLLFTVLYLLAYRRFLDAPTLANGALWGLTMAGLLYSKYHGVMLISFSVLPHLFWLLRKPGAWVAALGGAALFMPHLYWQYANDFPSFRYHLSGRNDAYEFKFTLEYLANQLVIFSPFLVWHYVQTFRKDSGHDRFGVANRWLVIGFLLFFFYTTTKGGTEAQWTALLSMPLVYLTFRAARDRFPEWRGQLWRLCLICGGILLLVRVLLVAPREWLPFDKPFDHQPWVERLAEEAGDLPVMVQNSYRLASLYEFYSGKPAWTFTDVQYRLNQYDLWMDDSVYNEQPVLLLGQKTWNNEAATPFRTHTRDMLWQRVDQFPVAKGLRLTPAEPLPDTLRRGKPVAFKLLADVPQELSLSGGFSLSPFIIFHFPDGTMSFYKLGEKATNQLTADQIAAVFTGNLRIMNNLPPGPAVVEFGMGYPGMPPLRGQSELVEVMIE